MIFRKKAHHYNSIVPKLHALLIFTHNTLCILYIPAATNYMLTEHCLSFLRLQISDCLLSEHRQQQQQLFYSSFSMATQVSQ